MGLSDLVEEVAENVVELFVHELHGHFDHQNEQQIGNPTMLDIESLCERDNPIL